MVDIVIYGVIMCALSGCNYINGVADGQNFSNSLYANVDSVHQFKDNISSYVGVENGDDSYIDTTYIKSDGRKLVRSVNTELIVATSEELDEAVKYVSDSTSRYGGRVLYWSTDLSGKYDVGQLIVRIPSDSVDSFMSDASRQFFEIGDTKIYYEDVTAEYDRLADAIQVKENEIATYQELLNGTSDDSIALSIQKELNIVIEDLSEAQLDMNLFDYKVDYTEICIDVDYIKIVF